MKDKGKKNDHIKFILQQKREDERFLFYLENKYKSEISDIDTYLKFLSEEKKGNDSEYSNLWADFANFKVNNEDEESEDSVIGNCKVFDEDYFKYDFYMDDGYTESVDVDKENRLGINGDKEDKEDEGEIKGDDERSEIDEESDKDEEGEIKGDDDDIKLDEEGEIKGDDECSEIDEESDKDEEGEIKGDDDDIKLDEDYYRIPSPSLNNYKINNHNPHPNNNKED